MKKNITIDEFIHYIKKYEKHEIKTAGLKSKFTIEFVNESEKKITYRMSTEKTDTLSEGDINGYLDILNNVHDESRYEIRPRLNKYFKATYFIPLLKLYDDHQDLQYEKEEDEKFREGTLIQAPINRYERNQEARKKCLEHYGYNCSACGMNFQNVYGEIGKGFIHVHHLKPLSQIGEEYTVDPIQDLRPVCPNCHAMLHKKGSSLNPEDLKLHHN